MFWNKIIRSYDGDRQPDSIEIPDRPSIYHEFIDGEWIENTNKKILQQISQLESTITPRRQREAILGTDNGWLANVDAQIAALRSQLK